MVNKKNVIKFLIIELIICSLYFIYKLNIYDKSILLMSYTILLIIEYFCSITLIFDKRFNIKQFLLYILLSYLSFILKSIYSNIYLSDINIFIIVGLLSSFIFYIFCKFILIFSLFNEEKIKFIDKIKKSISYINNNWNKFINLKYLKFIFKFLPKNIIIFCFLVLNIFYIIAFYKNYDQVNLYHKVNPTGNVGPITQTLDINFENIKVDGDINKICFLFGTYNRVNDSNLEFILYNKKNDVILSKKINTKILKDGDNYCFSIDKIKKDNIKKYHIKIVPKNTDDLNYVTIYKNIENDEYSISFMKSSSILSYKVIAIVIFLIVYLMINYFINKKGEKFLEHKFYLGLLIYLVPTMFIIPALEVPDEPTHYFSAYNLSQNGLNADIKNEISVPDNSECLNYAEIENRDSVANFSTLLSCFESKKNVKVSSLNGTTNYANKTYAGYISTAIGIKITDFLSNSPLAIFFTGRLFNMLISFVIIYYAIKISPKYKKIILFVATIPMFIQQMCSVSYDAILNATCIFYFAYCIKLIYNKKKISIFDNMTLVFLLYIIYTIKPVYLPLAIILLFVPKKNYRSLLKKILSFILIIFSIFLIDKIITSFVFIPIESINDKSSNLQLQYLLKYPMNIFHIAFNTFKINGLFYLQSLIGYFGWFKFHLWNIFIYCIYIGLIIN